jgi:bifunctional oligoribonuclease and PAP phosphatase NrnA
MAATRANTAIPEKIVAGSGIEAILRALQEGERFLVCSHSRPDGDAVGSVLAMGMLLEQMGKRADRVTADRVPVPYRKLPGVDSIRNALRVRGQYDAAILLECDSYERTRLRGLEQYPIINIDHHASGHAWGQVNWIDRSAASVGELVYRLVKAASRKLTPEMATCLYTTLLTDTGGFCYGALREATFALAQELVAAGANPIRIAQEVYFSQPASKLLLLGKALNTLRTEECVAWLWIDHEEVLRTQATEEDCEGIANYALSVAGVEAAAFFRELAEGRIRVSLRSKGRVNVAAIAERMGGGGHENASGCSLDGPMERAREVILAALREGVALAGCPE